MILVFNCHTIFILVNFCAVGNQEYRTEKQIMIKSEETNFITESRVICYDIDFVKFIGLDDSCLQPLPLGFL